MSNSSRKIVIEFDTKGDEKLNASVKRLENAAKGLKEGAKGLDDFEKIFSSSNSGTYLNDLLKYKTELRSISKELKESSLNQSDYNRYVSAMSPALRQAVGDANKLGKEIRELGQAQKDSEDAAFLLGTSIGTFIGSVGSQAVSALMSQVAQLPSYFASLTKSFIETGKEISTTSAKLKIGAESISAIRYAAESAGSNLGQFTDAFAEFIGEMSDAGKESKAIFKQLGIDVKEGLKSPETAFSKFLEQFSKLKDDGKKTALVMELFGESGRDLIPTFTALGSNMDLAKEKAKFLGVAFDEDAAKKAKILGQSLNDLSFIAEGVGNRFITQFADNIQRAMITAGDVTLTASGIILRQLQEVESGSEITSLGVIKNIGKIAVQIVPIASFIKQSLLLAGGSLAIGLELMVFSTIKAIETGVQLTLTPINILIEGLNQIRSFADAGSTPIPKINIDFGSNSVASFIQTEIASLKKAYDDAGEAESARIAALSDYNAEYEKVVKKRLDIEKRQTAAQTESAKALKSLKDKNDSDSPKSSKSKLAEAGLDEFATNRQKALFNQGLLNLPSSLKKEIEEAANQYRIPLKLALAQIFSESSFQTDAKSPFNKNVGDHAYGLTQQLPATASRMLNRKVTGKELQQNTGVALSAWGEYMSFLFNRYGDWELATLAYHQGEGTVDKLVRILDGGKSATSFFKARPKGKAYVRKIAALSGIRGDEQFEQGQPTYSNLLTSTAEVTKDGISERQLDAQSKFILGLYDAFDISKRSQDLNDRQLHFYSELNAKIEDYNLSLKEQMQDVQVENELLKYRNIYQESQIESYKQLNAQIREIGDVERDLLVLKAQNLDDQFTEQRRLLAAKREEYDLQKEITNLQDDIANFDVNQGLKSQVEYWQTVLELRNIQKELSQKGTFNPLQSELELTSYLNQNVKSVTQSYVDFRTTIADGAFQQIDSPFDRLRSKLESLPPLIKGIATAFVNLANDMVRAFSQKLISQILGVGGGGQQQSGGFSVGNLLQGFFNGGGGASSGGFSAPGFAGGSFNIPGNFSFAGAGGNGFSLPSLNLGTGGGNNFARFGGTTPSFMNGDLLGGSSPTNQVVSQATSQLSNYTKFKSLFSGKGNLLGSMAPMLGMSLGGLAGGQSTAGQILGSIGGLGAGLLGGIATGAINAGTMFGGVFASGGALSIGGLSAAMSATVVLAPIAGALLIGSLLLKRNAARRRDETTRDKLMVDSLAELNKIKAEMEAARPGTNIQGLLDQTGEISGEYFKQANALKDKKTRGIAIKDGNERVGVVPPNAQFPNALTNQIYALSEAAKAKEAMRDLAGERDRRMLPEFAMGGFIPAKRGGHLAVVGEGGYDEFILSTDPKYANQTANLLGNFIEKMNYKIPKFQTGGISSGVNLSQSNSISQTSGGAFQPNITIVVKNVGIVESDIEDILVDGLKKPNIKLEVVKAYDDTKPRQRGRRY